MPTTLHDDIDTEFAVDDLPEDDKRLIYAEIAGLDSTTSWTALLKSIATKEKVLNKALSSGLLHGDISDPVKFIEYTRGQLAALRWVRSAPSNADRVWKKLSAKTEGVK